MSPGPHSPPASHSAARAHGPRGGGSGEGPRRGGRGPPHPDGAAGGDRGLASSRRRSWALRGDCCSSHRSPAAFPAPRPEEECPPLSAAPPSLSLSSAAVEVAVGAGTVCPCPLYPQDGAGSAAQAGLGGERWAHSLPPCRRRVSVFGDTGDIGCAPSLTRR